jgi:hypothetical protein
MEGERMTTSVSNVSPISARIQSIKCHGHGFHVKLMDLVGRKELIAIKRIAWGNCRTLYVTRFERGRREHSGMCTLHDR